MFKVLNGLGQCFGRRPVYWMSSDKRSQFVPTLINQSNDFYNNIYGISLQKHVLPHNTYHFNWKAQEMKEYRKKMPNYVVVLINKVIEDAAQIDLDQQDSVNNKFYKLSTYCKIKYHANYTELIGLYKVKINKIQELKDTAEATAEKKEQTVEYSVQDIEDEVVLGGQERSEVVAGNLRKINLTLYSLQVQKAEDAPLVLNHQIEIKMKYLLQTYKKFFPVQKYKFLLFNPSEAGKNIYLIAQQLSNQNFKPKQIQNILQKNEYQQKMDELQELMDKTFDWKQTYKDFEKAAQSNLRNKKFYQYYSEILKIAKQKIDGKKGKQLFLEKVSKDFNKMKPPKEIKEVFEQEKEKYMQMEETAVQSGVIKKYLQDLSKIPYSIKSEETFDLAAAEKALDAQHYGMKDVKDAILQIIAVGKLKSSLKGKIFCFIGGPGLGKTTIAKSIANALGRKFYNISLGGVTDSSVLKGHRRTYVAAYAGKIIQALKHCETNNPVILLDQIDKMGSGSQGDPRSELLQILDPNQNSSFVDNYIDHAIDLSNVLFICSANYERHISKPLLDRMEKIYLNSYTDDEKKEIFNKHLLRRAINKTGVRQDQFKLDAIAIQALIHNYSLGEPGVRRLQKNIEKILERIAFKIVEQNQSIPIQINPNNLRDFLGNSYFHQRDHASISIGMAISLGGGDYGSRLTYIESFKKSFVNKRQQRRGVMFTGSLGDVFKEAMNISYTYARNFLLTELGNKFLYENEVHIHAPDGAAKKDGSTDSLTIASSLVSLALQKQVKKGIAMTGELTLHGKILRTNGIKEKVLLARRQKISQVIIPYENEADVSMLAQNIKQGIRFHFVSDFKGVFSILFEPYQPVSIVGQVGESVGSRRVEAVI